MWLRVPPGSNRDAASLRIVLGSTCGSGTDPCVSVWHSLLMALLIITPPSVFVVPLRDAPRACSTHLYRKNTAYTSAFDDRRFVFTLLPVARL